MMEEHRYPRKFKEMTWQPARRGRQIKRWQTVICEITSATNFNLDSLNGLTYQQAAARVRRELSKHDRFTDDQSAAKKSELELYCHMNDPEGIKPYFKGPLTLGQRLKFKFKAGCIPLNSKFAHIQKCSRACSLCGAEVEDIPHFILHCPELNTLRDALLSEISGSATKTVLDSFNQLKDLPKAAAPFGVMPKRD